MKDDAPVLDWHTPFFLNIHNCQIDCLLYSIVIRELDFCFGVFSYSPVKIFLLYLWYRLTF